MSGLSGRPDDVASGLAAMAEVFATTAMVIDATWAGALEAGTSVDSGAEMRLSGELVSADRVLGIEELGRLDTRARLGVDAFLARALGLSRASRVSRVMRGSLKPSAGSLDLFDPVFSESPGAWPQLDLPPARVTRAGLADRAIAGIRSHGQRLRGAKVPRALPARVPGPFAAVWTRRWYGGDTAAGGPSSAAGRRS